uniref:tRNA pseudouridine synthase n=1 Tax=Zosterops lateralis melanops TaxID=1220523 RepID=A0A8D2P5B9_ZOSLA
MREGAQFLLGTHDFSTFRSLNSESSQQSPVRTVLFLLSNPIYNLSLIHLPQHLGNKSRQDLSLEPPRAGPPLLFCFPQVRRMVGALVAVGQGKLCPGHIQELLEVKDSRAFPPHAMAPPSGLFLKSVEYNLWSVLWFEWLWMV